MQSYLLALLTCGLCLGSAVADDSGNLKRGAKPSTFCSTVKSLVTKGNYQSAATAYCSSYLSIPKSTKTITTVVASGTTSTTTTTSTKTNNGPAVTSTTTVDSTESITSTDTEFVTVFTSTDQVVTTIPTGCPSAGPPAAKKRNAGKSKPACFKSYTLSSIISSACKCLSITPSTVTTTSTSTISKDVTSTTTEVSTELAVQTTTTTTFTNTITTSADTVDTTTITISTDTTTTSTTFTSTSAFPTSFVLYDPVNQRYGIILNLQYLTSRYISSGSDATPYYLNAAGNLFEANNNRIAAIANGGNPTPVFYGITANNLECDIFRQADNSCGLECTNVRNLTLFSTRASSGNSYVGYIGTVNAGDGAFVPRVVDTVIVRG